MNVTDGLEPHLAKVLNVRLEQVKDFFFGQINLISQYADQLRERVAMMENTNKDGMKYADMNTESLIERMAAVEDLKREQNRDLEKQDPTPRNRADSNRPQIILNHFHTYFG